MSQLTYRLATLSDFEDLYRIKCDKENIAWGGFTKAPEKDSFYQWYLRQYLTVVGYTLYMKERIAVVSSM